MKKQILKVIGGASLAILALALFTQVFVSAQDKSSEAGEQSLAGSWDVRVTARDCESGAPIPFIPIFPALMTYEQDGTMQETDLGGPGTTRLPGHGVWSLQPRRQYSAAFRFLNFNPDRSFAGTNVVRSAIVLDPGGDGYTSTDTLEILDANGGLLATGCATSTATRFE